MSDPRSVLAFQFLRWQRYPFGPNLTCSGGGGPGTHDTDLVLAADHETWISLRCPTCGFAQHIWADNWLGLQLMAFEPPPEMENFYSRAREEARSCTGEG